MYSVSLFCCWGELPHTALGDTAAVERSGHAELLLYPLRWILPAPAVDEVNSHPHNSSRSVYPQNTLLRLMCFMIFSL